MRRTDLETFARQIEALQEWTEARGEALAEVLRIARGTLGDVPAVRATFAWFAPQGQFFTRGGVRTLVWTEEHGWRFPDAHTYTIAPRHVSAQALVSKGPGDDE